MKTLRLLVPITLSLSMFPAGCGGSPEAIRAPGEAGAAGMAGDEAGGAAGCGGVADAGGGGAAGAGSGGIAEAGNGGVAAAGSGGIPDAGSGGAAEGGDAGAGQGPAGQGGMGAAAGGGAAAGSAGDAGAGGEAGDFMAGAAGEAAAGGMAGSAGQGPAGSAGVGGAAGGGGDPGAAGDAGSSGAAGAGGMAGAGGAIPASPRRVFLSSTQVLASIGGVADVDALCQSLADGATLGGVYKAWLSDDSSNPAASFVRSSQPYQLVDGTTIADDWTDLTDGELAQPINLDETGQQWLGVIDVWTATSVAGQQTTTAPCSNWTAAAEATYVGIGRANDTATTWTQDMIQACTTSNVRVYCFEQ